MATVTNKYEPTPCEEKLLQVLANPENIGKNVTDICQIAGISRDVYYKAYKKEGFVEYQQEMCRDLVKQSLLPVVNAFTKEALKGSYNHGKIILEMANLYTERKEVRAEVKSEVKASNEVQVKLAEDEEGRELLKQLYRLNRTVETSS